jgi:hypothetical protein
MDNDNKEWHEDQHEDIAIVEPTAEVPAEPEELHYPVLRDFNTGTKGFVKDDIISIKDTTEYQLRWLKIDGFVGSEAI